MLSIMEKENFVSYPLSWNSLDCAVALWSSLKGFSGASYCLTRPNGSKDYQIVVSVGGKEDVDFSEALNQAPTVRDYFFKRGLSLDQDDINAFVCDLVLEDNWNTYFDKEKKSTRSIARKISIRPDWLGDENLGHLYWSSVLIAQDYAGRPEDQSFKKLFNLMSVPATKESIKSTADILKKIMERRPNWEATSCLSFRVFAKNSPRWHALLDQFDISYKQTHEGFPVLMHAIKNGNTKTLLGWAKETGMSLALVPSSGDIPKAWVTEEFSSPSLWHLVASQSPLPLFKDREDLGAIISDVNDLDKNNRNALHWACSFGNLPFIQYLVDLGVSLHQEDYLGKTPSEYLPEGSKEFDEIFDFLEQRRMNETGCQKIAS